MLSDLLLTLTKEAILVTVVASLPAIGISLAIGLMVAIFSATTQIQEQTLSFAPKMIAVYGTFIAFAVPVGTMILNFSKKCFTQFLAFGP